MQIGRTTFIALIFVGGCGGQERVAPERPPASAVSHWEKKLGPSAQDCGQARQGAQGDACAAQRVFECLHSALSVCRPARGVWFTLTGEGDAVRSDFFVADKAGVCTFVVVQDRSADPLAKPPIAEQECRSASWQPQPDNPSCQILSPVDCGRGAHGL